jgi:hypothetical protein
VTPVWHPGAQPSYSANGLQSPGMNFRRNGSADRFSQKLTII